MSSKPSVSHSQTCTPIQSCRQLENIFFLPCQSPYILYCSFFSAFHPSPLTIPPLPSLSQHISIPSDPISPHFSWSVLRLRRIFCTCTFLAFKVKGISLCRRCIQFAPPQLQRMPGFLHQKARRRRRMNEILATAFTA